MKGNKGTREQGNKGTREQGDWYYRSSGLDEIPITSIRKLVRADNYIGKTGLACSSDLKSQDGMYNVMRRNQRMIFWPLFALFALSAVQFLSGSDLHELDAANRRLNARSLPSFSTSSCPNPSPTVASPSSTPPAAFVSSSSSCLSSSRVGAETK
jgi:hypothetical protein